MRGAGHVPTSPGSPLWPWLAGVVLVSTTVGRAGHAQAPPSEQGAEAPPASEAPPAEETSPADSKRAEARQAFVVGAEHAKNARWPEALAAFERAASIQDHPVTTYNIGACERALGMYARARLTFGRALDQRADDGAALPDGLRQKAEGFLTQIDRLLVELTVTVEPATAAITIDGRTLVGTEERRAKRPVHILSDRVADKPQPAPGKTFVVLLDPGAHVISLTRPGFAPAIVNRTFTPQQKASLTLELDRLPATLSVRSSPSDAIVTLGDKDLGPTPLEVLRPPGRYDVVIERDGYLPYETQLDVTAGQQVKLHPRLQADEPTIWETWWFWTIAGTVVTGAVVGTYFAVRSDPEPTRDAVSGGTFGYTIEIP